jgi:hypothetical protein
MPMKMKVNPLTVVSLGQRVVSVSLKADLSLTHAHTYTHTHAHKLCALKLQ